MKVTVDTDELFEAYDAAETDAARQKLRELIVDASEAGITDLYPQVTQFPDLDVEAMMDDIDADEIVDELEDDEPVPDIDEAREMLNEQTPSGFGAVIKAGDDVTGDLYVASPNSGEEDMDCFDTPEGWTAIPDGSGSYSGVGFVRTDGIDRVDDLWDYLEAIHGNDDLFYMSSNGPADGEQLYYIGPKRNLPDGWETDDRMDDPNYIVRADE